MNERERNKGVFPENTPVGVTDDVSIYFYVKKCRLKLAR